MIGVIVRQDLTGLGVQTRSIARLLSADRVIAIDFSSVNGNRQHTELLDGLSGEVYTVNGWIQPWQFDVILTGLKVLITCEIDYSNYKLIERAKELGVKTVVVANYEFADWLQRDVARPDVIANHSIWSNDRFEQAMGQRIPVIETPTYTDEYIDIYENNRKRNSHPRFLHVAGRKTHLDRNGTEDLLAAIRLIPQDVNFELTIKTQTVDVQIDDGRIKVDTSVPSDERLLYAGFDAMILPRRYAGGCLPMQEALAAGLPVIMTDIDPNNKILPAAWLIEAEKKTEFMARTNIEVFSANHQALAEKIISLAKTGKSMTTGHKDLAREIAIERFSDKAVKHKWDLLIRELGV